MQNPIGRRVYVQQMLCVLFSFPLARLTSPKWTQTKILLKLFDCNDTNSNTRLWCQLRIDSARSYIMQDLNKVREHLKGAFMQLNQIGSVFLKSNFNQIESEQFMSRCVVRVNFYAWKCDMHILQMEEQYFTLICMRQCGDSVQDCGDSLDSPLCQIIVI